MGPAVQRVHHPHSINSRTGTLSQSTCTCVQVWSTPPDVLIAAARLYHFCIFSPSEAPQVCNCFCSMVPCLVVVVTYLQPILRLSRTHCGASISQESCVSRLCCALVVRKGSYIRLNCSHLQKYWITNSALHAKWSVVFAQLIIKGSNEGIHAFLVRIRDEQMQPMPNVRIEDMGHKMGCNGATTFHRSHGTIPQYLSFSPLRCGSLHA